jgi:hypothetical protein
MALQGSPRDMNKWREVLLDPRVRFPSESAEYRRARNRLLASEDALRQLTQQVAAERRALPAGGLTRPDYVFESAADGGEVRFSELFAPGKDSLVIYNMMFPRWSEDPRAVAPGGETLAGSPRRPGNRHPLPGQRPQRRPPAALRGDGVPVRRRHDLER